MPAAPNSANSTRTVWSLLLVVFALIGVFAVIAWIWQKWADPARALPQPAPVYLSLAKIDAKTSDGAVLALKVGLQLEREGDDQKLRPYSPVFQNMVTSMTAELTHKELSHPRGMADMSDYIEYTFNDYLSRQGVPERINGVLFEEWLLLM